MTDAHIQLTDRAEKGWISSGFDCQVFQILPKQLTLQAPTPAQSAAASTQPPFWPGLHIRTQLRNHHESLRHYPVPVEGVQLPLITFSDELEAQCEIFTQEIEELLATGEWSKNAQLLRTIPGLGPMTVAWLLVATQNFQLCQTQEELVAYAGLAPMPYESGSRIRRRRSIGYAGSGYLRKALYLATLSAAQNNPIIKEFYTRLKNSGKPMKVARCAAARKLLVIAWAIVKKQRSFEYTNLDSDGSL